ncbi:hypothetical protein Tco_1177164 [Tanacetum coccineum]
MGSVTPFVRWIEDYPLLDGLKMPAHIGDPDNFLHLFEGAIRMKKWVMPVAWHMFTYTLRDSARIWWNGQKPMHHIKQRENESTRAFVTRYTDDTLQILGLHEDQRISGFVHGLRNRSLVEFLSTDLPATYKGLMEKTYTWIEAKEVSTNGDPIENREGHSKFPKHSSWEGPKNKHKNRDRFTPYNKGSNHGPLGRLIKSPKEILATERAAKAFEPPPRMTSKGRNRDTTKYCHFHEDYGHETNSCRELKRQIDKAVKSGQLAHLVKGIKKGKEKISATQLGKDTTPPEAPILMIRWGETNLKRK